MDAKEAKRVAREAREARGQGRQLVIADAREAIESCVRDGQDEMTLRLEPVIGSNPQARANQIKQSLEQDGYEVDLQNAGDVVLLRVVWKNAPDQATLR